MTRKDYIRIAQALREAALDIQNKEPPASQETMLDGLLYAMDHLADALKADNSAFDRERFRDACIRATRSTK